jgi:hypothetical protein
MHLLLCFFFNPLEGGAAGGASGAPGGPVGIIVGAIVGFIGSLLFGGGGPSTSQVVSWASQGFQMAGEFIQSVSDYATMMASTVKNFLDIIWKGFFLSMLQKLWTLFDKLHAWLEARLGPILSFLLKVRTYIDRIFNIYVKPFLDLLQHIRQVLAVLRLLHIKWAAALDAKIAAIETTVASYFLLAKSILNGLIDITNAVIDPLRLFTKPILVISIRRTIHAMIRLATGLPPGFFFPSPRAGAAKGVGTLPLNFLPSDPSMNPPASNYLPGNDGFGNWNGFTNTTNPEDTAVDQGGPLDYFNDGLYPPSPCGDPISCFADALNYAAGNKTIG